MKIIETSFPTPCFGTLTAVNALNLPVAAGEVFGLLGSNGARKTIVVKRLTTLPPPTLGKAKVVGFNMQAAPRVVFTWVRAISTGTLPRLDFIGPGVPAQSVVFVAVLYDIVVIWDRGLGVVHKLLVSPAPRLSLLAGKAISAGVCRLAHGCTVFLLAWLRINRRIGVPSGMTAAVMLGAPAFSLINAAS